MDQAEIELAPSRTSTRAAMPWLMLTVAWLAQTSIYLGAQATPPVAPLMQDDLHITRAQVGLFASAFSTGAMLTLIPSGWLADRFGVRLLLLIGPCIAGLLLIAAAHAPSFWTVALFILLAGLGGGMTSPSTTKAVMSWFSAKTRGTAMGIKQTGTSLGGAIAAATLPAIALASGWRDAVTWSGCAIAVVGVLSYVVFRDHPTAKPSTAARSSGALRAVLVDRDVQLSCLAAVCFTAVQMTIATYLVLYLHEALSMPLAAAGAMLALTQFSGVAGRIVLGIASDRLLGGRRRRVLVLTGLGSLASALVAAVAGSSLPTWGLVALVVVLGFAGIGWTGIFMTLISELSGKGATGVGSAVGLTACNIGILIGPPLFGLLVDLSHSYATGWTMVAVASAIGTVLILPVRERLS